MKELYEKILTRIKQRGIKVIHKRKCKGYLAYYYNHHIVIQACYKNTLLGCIFLLHEYCHLLDDNAGRFRLFYTDAFTRKDISMRKKRDIIWKAEWNCFEYSYKILREYGITRKDSEYFQKSWVKREILPTMIENYLK